MSARRRLTRGDAEQLLRRAASGSPDDPDPLVRLLAAAAAPPRQAEAGDREEAALAAFREARRGPVRTRGWRPAGSVLVRLLATKAAVAVLATATGGVAITAGAVSLADRQHDRPPKRPGTSATPASPGASSRPALSTPPKATTGPVSSGPSRSPSPTELCRAYRAIGPQRQKALVRPAFAPLVAAAGGEHRVAGYCAKLLRGPKGEKPVRPPQGKPKKSKDVPSSIGPISPTSPTKAPHPNVTRSHGGSPKLRFDPFRDLGAGRRRPGPHTWS
jgi:hypothetical protein